MCRRFLWGCLLLLLLPGWVQAATVKATLDRDSVQLGETVTLNVQIDDAGGAVSMPDLDALQQDFDILRRSQNRSLSVINGTATSSLTIGVALRPKHVGTLQIPALSVAGARTAPLQLQVTPADPNTVTAHQDVFLQAQVEPGHAYVGQQLSYVVRLYYALSLSGGTLTPPELEGAQLTQVGDDLNYAARRGGRTYHVLERRYAVTPTHAGRLDIGAATFQGEAVDRSDPNSFFGYSTPVSARAQALSVAVQAVPAKWGESAWLPARKLSLTLQGWPAAGEDVRVGQALNLTMTVQATGLPFEALPPLTLPTLEGAKAYPDKPVTQTQPDGPWLVGQRRRTFALVPEQAGTLTMPATTVRWWNVQTDRMELATIPAHSVTVLPAAGGAVAAKAASALADATTPAKVASRATAEPALPWRMIALASGALWLLSLLGWLWWRRRGRSGQSQSDRSSAATRSDAGSARHYRQAFLAAARGHDAAAQTRSLLAWARTERPAIAHLGQLAAALDDAAQRAAIASLQQRHYAATVATAGDSGLADAFKRGLAWRVATTDAQTPDLPPLYPFNTH